MFLKDINQSRSVGSYLVSMENEANVVFSLVLIVCFFAHTAFGQGVGTFVTSKIYLSTDNLCSGKVQSYQILAGGPCYIYTTSGSSGSFQVFFFKYYGSLHRLMSSQFYFFIFYFYFNVPVRWFTRRVDPRSTKH